MGEILRAVMDKSCIFSAPRWYTLEIQAPNPITTTSLSATLQCKSDRFFLMTGANAMITQPNGALALPVAPSSITGDVLFTLQDPKNNKNLQLTPMAQPLFGSGQNLPLTYPEYYLWEPGALIRFVFSNNADPANIVPFAFTSWANFLITLTLTGIEYARA